MCGPFWSRFTSLEKEGLLEDDAELGRTSPDGRPATQLWVWPPPRLPGDNSPEFLSLNVHGTHLGFAKFDEARPWKSDIRLFLLESGSTINFSSNSQREHHLPDAELRPDFQRPVELSPWSNTSSPKAWLKAENWIRTRVQKHPKCNGTKQSRRYPTRLLGILHPHIRG